MKRIALITGATSGFGEAATRRFIQEGWYVIGTGRRAERLDEMHKVLGERFFPLCFDVRDAQCVNAGIASLPSPWRDIDLLINNAGLAIGMGSVEHGELSNWETMIDTNIKGLLYVTKALLAGLLKKEQGHIINLGSVAGNYPYPGANVYGATKAFVNMFSLELRADLLGKNIRVSSIEPGFCETEFSLVRFAGDKEKAKAFYDGMLPLTAEDIAESLYWCASLPPHMNVNRLELMPTRQSFAPFAVYRDEGEGR